jgi:hypothetical protein
MDAGIINVIYMELYSGPKMANGTCGKMIVTGTIDRGSAVLQDKSFVTCQNLVSESVMSAQMLEVWKKLNSPME